MRLAALALLLLHAAAADGAASSDTDSSSAAPVTLAVTVNDTAVTAVLDDFYLGYNIDSGSLYHGIALSNPVFTQLARNLAPAQLRIGGTASDSLWYVPDAPDGATQGPTPDPLIPNAAQVAAPGYNGFVPQVTVVNNDMWREITGFTTATGLSLLWDFNAVDFRTAAGAWSPSLNASALMEYTSTQNLLVGSWELGNEPDIWYKHFNMNVSGTQLATDLRTLQQTLASYPGLSTAVSGPSLAEFDAPLVQEFLQQWQASGGGLLSFTAHAYPLGPPSFWPQSNRPSCSVNNYLNLTRVNNVASYLAEFSAAVAQYGDPTSTRMVLEETASNSMGGCVGFSDRFISGFYFTNILGVVAEAGWQQLNRQDLAGMSFTANGSQYTLFGPPGWVNGSGLVSPTSPHPDYFTALLWSKLMGKRVLTSSVMGDATGGFSTHVWCAAATAPGAGAGAVTVAYLNTYDTPASFTIAGADGRAYALSPRSHFFLTAENLTDASVYLNLAPKPDRIQRANARLGVRHDGSLPASLDKPTGRLVRDTATHLTVPAFSYGYIVLPAAGVAVCTATVVPVRTKLDGERRPRFLMHLSAAIGFAAVVAGTTLALIWRKTRLGAQERNLEPNWRARLLPKDVDMTRYGALV